MCNVTAILVGQRITRFNGVFVENDEVFLRDAKFGQITWSQKIVEPPISSELGGP